MPVEPKARPSFVSHSGFPNSPPCSLPSSPLLTPVPSSGSSRQWPGSLSAGMQRIRAHQNRLLIPVMHPPRRTAELVSCSAAVPPRSPRTKSTTKQTKSAVEQLNYFENRIDTRSDGGVEPSWFLENFEIAQERLEIEGYQIYAVEKWVVERRLVTVLTVYTGDPHHKVTVTAFSLSKDIAETDAQVEWSNTLHHLRRDGARPKETPNGTTMVTSLANFRSDYTIVHIPTGNFLEVREQLYTNINLLRMGCSGRSALTLEEPSDTTKDRFISMYHLQDSVRSKGLFSTTVLELVKIVQAALMLFGMFPSNPEERDGLLCDISVDGIQRWVNEVGEPYVGVEPMERLGDPSITSALLSVVVAMRTKLSAIGFAQLVPKDPFLDPAAFVHALASFQSSRMSPNVTSPLGFTSSSRVVVLTRPLMQTIDVAYDKSRQNDSFKVHKVLLNKLDDLTTDLRTPATASSKTEAMSATSAMSDLRAFTHAMKGKDGVASLRYLWTGRAQELRRMMEAVYSDGEKDGEKDKEREKVEGKTIEEEIDFLSSIPWSGRMQRKMNAWANLSRSRKPLSVDLSTKIKPLPLYDSSSQPTMSSQVEVPSVILSRDTGEEDEILSSGQVSPISPNPSMVMLGTFPSAGSSIGNLSEYDRRVLDFNKKRPTNLAHIHNRITSWADPVSAKEILGADDLSGSQGGSVEQRYSYSSDDETRHEFRNTMDDLSLDDMRRRLVVHCSGSRRHSFSDASSFRSFRRQNATALKTDVELCGQLVILRRREIHLQTVVSCLQILTASLSTTNASLHEGYRTHQPVFGDLKSRTKLTAEIEAIRNKVDTITQETHALSYEAQQFRVPELWHMASPPRQKVLTLREKVFGTGRRLAPGSHGAHDLFNRLQWSLDGQERLVDWLGRTESEVEEEVDLPKVAPWEDDEDVVEHPAMRPTWLLRFFHSWGARWGASSGQSQLAEGKN